MTWLEIILTIAYTLAVALVWACLYYWRQTLKLADELLGMLDDRPYALDHDIHAFSIECPNCTGQP